MCIRDSNTADKLNALLIKALVSTGELNEVETYDVDLDVYKRQTSRSRNRCKSFGRDDYIPRIRQPALSVLRSLLLIVSLFLYIIFIHYLLLSLGIKSTPGASNSCCEMCIRDRSREISRSQIIRNSREIISTQIQGDQVFTRAFQFCFRDCCNT